MPSTWDGIAPLQEAVLIAALALLLGASSDQKVQLMGKFRKVDAKSLGVITGNSSVKCVSGT